MICTNCGFISSDTANFCTKCGCPLGNGQNTPSPIRVNSRENVPQSETDTVFFGADAMNAYYDRGANNCGEMPVQEAPFGAAPYDPEGKTVFMGDIMQGMNQQNDSEGETVFMGDQEPEKRANNGFAQYNIPSQVPSAQKKRSRTAQNYESTNVGISTPKKIIIIVGLEIIAALAAYLVYDFIISG